MNDKVIDFGIGLIYTGMGFTALDMLFNKPGERNPKYCFFVCGTGMVLITTALVCN